MLCALCFADTEKLMETLTAAHLARSLLCFERALLSPLLSSIKTAEHTNAGMSRGRDQSTFFFPPPPPFHFVPDKQFGAFGQSGVVGSRRTRALMP